MLDPDAYTSVPDRFDGRGQVDVSVDEYEARCRRCGCTEDRACEGGCAWATHEQQEAAGLDPMAGELCTACLARYQQVDGDDGDHCDHHEHDDRCGGYYDGGCEWDYGADYCCHCDCCCTCLGCEYGPRDGMLLTEAQRAAVGGAEVTA